MGSSMGKTLVMVLISAEKLWVLHGTDPGDHGVI